MATIEQTVHPDGRVELTDPEAVANSPYGNAELAPTRLPERHWTTYNYAALWMGMAHNIPSYLLAAGLVALGMNWQQAVHHHRPGEPDRPHPDAAERPRGHEVRHPVPGLRPRLLRRARRELPGAAAGRRSPAAGSASRPGSAARRSTCCSATRRGGWTNAAALGGHPWTLWLCFAFFWVLELAMIYRGMKALRRFENWAAPLRHRRRAGAADRGSRSRPAASARCCDQPSKLGWGADFWPVFFAVADGHDRASGRRCRLNIPDFTRFGTGQRAQVWGQIARPADDDDALRAALGHRHLRLAGRVRRGDLGPGRARRQDRQRLRSALSPW